MQAFQNRRKVDPGEGGKGGNGLAHNLFFGGDYRSSPDGGVGRFGGE